MSKIYLVESRDCTQAIACEYGQSLLAFTERDEAKCAAANWPRDMGVGPCYVREAELVDPKSAAFARMILHYLGECLDHNNEQIDLRHVKELAIQAGVMER